MREVVQQSHAAVQLIQARWPHVPRVGIILGSGLGCFADEVQQPTHIPYADIPYFPRSTAIGHAGRLVCGHCANVPVVTMQGRFHYYEGYSLQQVSLPVWVMRQLGIELLIASNASGGVNPRFRVGDIMILADHINLMFDNPLIGYHDDQLAPRIPGLAALYDPSLIEVGLQVARQRNFVAHQGVYAALTGPTYETRAEYRMLRRLGADAVGMSTVPEVLVAVHAGLRVFALSVITNDCKPDVLTPTHGEEVVQAANQAASKMRDIVSGVVRNFAANPAANQRAQP